MPRLKTSTCVSFVIALTLLTAPLTTAYAGSKAKTNGASGPVFDPNICTPETLVLGDQNIPYRACLNIVYVTKPVDTHFQSMNVYIPEAAFKSERSRRHPAKSVPIFMPNQVGGFNPGEPATIAKESVQYALSKGYVVAAPGARGKTQDYGRAPAGIVDLKAAVRYLHYNDAVMPGDAEMIISNGTSAGGAMSSLLGATGNNSDYEPYLEAIGAAHTRDDIFAASCYCPITNLNNADMAYEWLFNGQYDYNFITTGTLSPEQIVLSDLLKTMFPAYLNRLQLTAYEPRNDHGHGLKEAYGQIKQGPLLTLDEYSEGNFNDYAKSFIMASAQENLDVKGDLEVPRYGSALPTYMDACKSNNFDFLTIENGEVLDADLAGYAECVTRMKPVPAFDSVDLLVAASWENILFGTGAAIPSQHFTRFSLERDINGSDLMADPQIIKMMSPMDYIGTRGSTTTKNWRIRHGAADRDTSIAIPIMLATKLKNAGYDVDFALPWGVRHSGDYDLDELFAWIEKISNPPRH